jgi:protein O-GlcNAc transferase
MRLISMSLFGNLPRYCKGAIENAKICREIYPDWQMRVYCGSEVQRDTLDALVQHGCQVEVPTVSLKGPNHPLVSFGEGVFWRFLPATDPNNEYVLIRDVDSRLNVRERAAVDEWIRSGIKAHVMQDHPNHVGCWRNGMKIMAGMWGIKGGFINFHDLLRHWDFGGSYFNDQMFLAAKIWPLIQYNVMIHGPIGRAFPPHAPFNSFVGDAIVNV